MNLMEKRPPSGQRYLDSTQSLEEILLHMEKAQRDEWEKYGHLRVEPAFQDRLLAVYQACGKDSQGAQRPPKIHAVIRVLGFLAKDELGCVVRLENQATNEEMEVSYVPKKLFNFPIFVAVPPLFTLRWDLRDHQGKKLRSLSYLLFLKTRNKATFYSENNFYVETPNSMRTLYPGVRLDIE